MHITEGSWQYTIDGMTPEEILKAGYLVAGSSLAKQPLVIDTQPNAQAEMILLMPLVVLIAIAAALFLQSILRCGQE